MIQVQLNPAAALADQAERLRPEPRTIEIAYDLVKGAGGVQIVTGKELGNIARQLNPALLKGVARGYRWRSQLLAEEVPSVGELARQAGVSSRYVIGWCAWGFWLPTSSRPSSRAGRPPR
jgi:hypothetical protein